MQTIIADSFFLYLSPVEQPTSSNTNSFSVGYFRRRKYNNHTTFEGKVKVRKLRVTMWSGRRPLEATGTGTHVVGQRFRGPSSPARQPWRSKGMKWTQSRVWGLRIQPCPWGAIIYIIARNCWNNGLCVQVHQTPACSHIHCQSFLRFHKTPSFLLQYFTKLSK